jgi:NAD-dependent dihydropyrimidine dehydrogenase PreA subunit
MVPRDVIRIDETLCDGCGLCIEACAEGAIALVDGKARLVSESYCDGLGACLGHCPQGAITVERSAAAPFGSPAPDRAERPGSRAAGFGRLAAAGHGAATPSALRHWPVQLHLVAPSAPCYRGADVLLAADCVAYAVGDFHGRYLAGRSLAIACPKLDVRQEVYLDKLVAMIDEAEIASLTVMVMEVPCCGGLVRLAAAASARAAREVPVRTVVVGAGGEILGGGPLAGEAPGARPTPARAAAAGAVDLPVRNRS